MKKGIITSLILSLTCSAFAGITFQQDQQGYQAEKFLSVNPVFGFKNGTLGEYVFLTYYLFFCMKFQESSHISFIPFFASQPSSSFAFLASE